MQDTAPGLRVAMAQLNFKVGAIDENRRRIELVIQQAREDGADLVVFSEAALMGYPPRDAVDRRALIALQLKALDEIAAQTDDELAAIVGFIGDNSAAQGHSLINAAAFCVGGRVRRVVAKRLLPTYDVFDELRHFYPAATDAVVTHQGVRLGISICEDAWAKVKSREMPAYTRDPIADAVAEGAQILINIAASPFSLNKGEFRRDLLAHHASTHGRPIIFVNQVGGNDELIFDGRSLGIDADGQVCARLAEFKEDFQILKVGVDGGIEPEGAPRAVASSEANQARRAAVLGIRDYLHKSKFEKVLLGLSGGIDSAVTATLAAEALGPENVHGVAMPSRFSSDHSRSDARRLADNLGIRFSEIPIMNPYDSVLDALQPHFDDPSFGVTEENVQARLRGVYLMALSNKQGALVLACGNKSELAVGYTTLYGDMCGALAPLGDMPKMLVYDVARLYNEQAGREVIPQNIIDKAPSAELRPDQRDEDSLPPYDVLDEIVDLYVVQHLTVPEILERGFDADQVTDVVAKVHRSEFKRWQAPPILKITTKAFGMGWRYPLAAKVY